MSWIQKLCDTYDYAVTTSAITDEENPLPEMGFIIEKSTVEVTISGEGTFVDAERIPDKKQKTLIPCTIESGVARQNPVAPHPIFDKIKNLETEKQLSILLKWCNLEDTPLSVKSVYNYLSKQSLATDLEKCFSAKDAKWSSEDFVRFCIIDGEIDKPAGLWLREDVRDSWKNVFQTMLDEKDKALCYVTGQERPIAVKHPNALANSLLISMSKENCIGRFETDATEAVSVSCEASLKAHRTLKWLNSRQGAYLYGTQLAIWDTRGFDFPNITKFDPYGDDVIDDALPEANTDILLGKTTVAAAKGYFSKQLAAYDEHLRENKSSAVVMAIDSATGKGRASIIYYQELDGHEYLENLMYWYESFRWMAYRKSENGAGTLRPWSPLPRDICNLIYGKGTDEGGKKLKKQLMRQLLPCITTKKPISKSLVTGAFRKTANPDSFKDENGKFNQWDWNNALNITCALAKKYNYDKGDEHSMALDEMEKDHNYLYGRLLAYADEIENRALKQGESSRTTNAMRFMQRFQQRPSETWLMLRTQKLEPYIQKLTPKQQEWYRTRISEIEDKLDRGSILVTSPLNVRFLEGFSCQKMQRFAKKSEVGKVENNVNEEE